MGNIEPDPLLYQRKIPFPQSFGYSTRPEVPEAKAFKVRMRRVIYLPNLRSGQYRVYIQRESSDQIFEISINAPCRLRSVNESVKKNTHVYPSPSHLT